MIPDQFERLILSQVCYQHPGSTGDALKNITLEIRAGQSIGIIGSSGSGKTTLINLMLGFLKPKTGTIHAEFLGQKNIVEVASTV